jgi:single-stranded-DNA-specific exonuclease
MQKRWTFLKKDTQRIDALAQELKIHPVLCSILVQRGFDTFEKAKQYFRPQLSDLHDPWLMKDMQKAVDRLLYAFNSNEKILVFGD